MAEHRLDTAHAVRQFNAYARGIHREADDFALEVQKVYRGDWIPPKDVEETDIEVSRPAKAANILHKYLAMIAIRSRRTITVHPHDQTKEEEQRVDKLESVCHAWLRELEQQGQRNLVRDSAYWAFTCGRAGLHTVYDPNVAGNVKVRIRVPDPFTYWAVSSEHGVEWFTRHYWRTRLELSDFFAHLDTGDKGALFNPPDIIKLGHDYEVDVSLNDQFEVIEYWDSKYHNIVINDWHSGPLEHDYGFAPLVEMQIYQTPEEKKRWAYMGLLGYVLEDLKHYAALLSKMSTGVEQFYYPRLYYISKDGHIMQVDHHAPAGQFVEMMPGSDPIILNPQPNQEVLQVFLNEVMANITQGTLPNVVYVEDIPGEASGFMVNQIIGLIQDAIADKRDAIERAWSIGMGQGLQLHEVFAPLQPDGIWRYPIVDQKSKRKSLEDVSAQDIQKHYRVTFTVQAALPQDLIQKATLHRQLSEVDEMGRKKFDRDTLLRLSGLDREIEDLSSMYEAIDRDYLIAHDQEVAQLYMANIKAQNEPWIRDMRKRVKRYDRVEKRRRSREEERAIEEGMEEPLVIPADRKVDADLLRKMADLAAQGMNPELALEEELPLGVPNPLQPAEGMAGMPPVGQDGQPLSSDELNSLLRKLTGQAELGGPTAEGTPNLPFQGYEGISPAALPPAAQGALPRQRLDQMAVQAEAMQRQINRGALPPPK